MIEVKRFKHLVFFPVYQFRVRFLDTKTVKIMNKKIKQTQSFSSFTYQTKVVDECKFYLSTKYTDLNVKPWRNCKMPSAEYNSN